MSIIRINFDDAEATSRKGGLVQHNKRNYQTKIELFLLYLNIQTIFFISNC